MVISLKFALAAKVACDQSIKARAARHVAGVIMCRRMTEYRFPVNVSEID